MSDINAEPTKYKIGFDLGGTKMLAVVLDDKYKVVGRKKRKTKAYRGGDEGIKRIVETIEEALGDAKVSIEELAGIGIAAPAPLNLKKGILMNPTNMRWGDVPLKKLLEDRFHCEVWLYNDVDAGTYGEYKFGAGKGADCLLGVFPGTGIGGGCVFNGQLIQGETDPCMEIGHIIVRENGRLCGCGKRGCLEAECSRLAISCELAAVAYRGDAPNLFREAGTDISKMSSGVIARSIQEGDKIVERVVRDAARLLGVGVANAVNLLGPDVVVIGGGLVDALPGFFLKEVEITAKEGAFGSFKDKLKLKAAQMGDDASVLGAAALLTI